MGLSLKSLDPTRAVKKAVNTVTNVVEDAGHWVSDKWKKNVQNPLGLDNVEREFREFANPYFHAYGDILQGKVSQGIGELGGAFVGSYVNLANSGEVRTALQGADDAYNKAVGNETDAEKAARKEREAAANEIKKQSATYNDAINDKSIDEVSRKEIMDLYQSGAGSSKLASILAAARAGDKGVYAVRKMNQSQQDTLKMNPGRQGTVRSLGYGSVL